MTRISKAPDQLKARYDAIVVGSGYGGGVAASRLARMGYRVAVLERGREIVTGEFPDTIPEAQDELQVTGNRIDSGRETGLFDLRLGRDMHVLVGCGLGGTSLINANVSLPPDPRVWEDPVWPVELLHGDSLDKGFVRARQMLRPSPFHNKVALDKLARLRESAAALDSRVELPPLNIAFEHGPNAANVVQPACTLCGDCCSGCNVGAKSTVQLTYLADAVKNGAEVFTHVKVYAVERADEDWRIMYRPVQESRRQRNPFHEPERAMSAPIVVLAAGSLGSTEILLRSRERGLAVSDRLGARFTGNGDAIAFAYNNDRPVNGIGVGSPPRSGTSPPGPCIAGAIDLRGSDRLEDGMIIEEGVIPSGLSAVLPEILGSAADAFGIDTDSGEADLIEEKARQAKSALLGAYAGAVHNTQTFLVMAHDDANGRLVLDRETVHVDWPDVAHQPIYQQVEQTLYKATAATGGTYLRNPLQTSFLGRNLITVHPLGGCPMGHDRRSGVVDHACRVFDASDDADAKAVHDGLYVCDGAIIPRPIGVNPLLTITALAERAMIHLADRKGRLLSAAMKPNTPISYAAPWLDVEPRPAGVTFTERMTGFITEVPTRDYVEAERLGRRANQPLSFTATITITDVQRFLKDPEHAGRLSGTVSAPLLSPDPLDIEDGRFNLMRSDTDAVETRRFDYRMTLVGRHGRRYAFTGSKLVKNDPSKTDLWRDTTTLYVDVSELADDGATKSVARGMLSIDPADFARQMTTLKGTGGRTPAERFGAVALFGAVFAGTLFDVYGGVLAPLRRFDPNRARPKRQLRAGSPEVHYVSTKDAKRLRLTRYKGGDKGPVVLTHGLGVSSLIFSIDTIDTNLLEYLFEAGYDCWLLDYRASIDLPYAKESWTADDVAANDYQPAIDLVREVSGAPSVQVVAHCFGATTFVMSMLDGLEGVHSAVISQVATDVIVPWFPQRLLAHLRAPSLLRLLGIRHVDARATRQDGVAERLVDAFIRIFVPFQREERTRYATSNRITALYGQLYEADQLNVATFENGLPEMFGEANIDAFRHLARIARKRRVVDARGKNRYLDHLERLDIPLLFVHGAENACFKPESTALALDRLTEKNGNRTYKRVVIPKYGHIDCIFGKNAATDVYPHILTHLDRWERPESVVAAKPPESALAATPAPIAERPRLPVPLPTPRSQ